MEKTEQDLIQHSVSTGQMYCDKQLLPIEAWPEYIVIKMASLSLKWMNANSAC